MCHYFATYREGGRVEIVPVSPYLGVGDDGLLCRHSRLGKERSWSESRLERDPET